jgi:CubicO group peptidase (beta-lactamase class C family)
MWTPDEQLIGYRNIDRIFDTRLVRAGSNPRPIAIAETPLSVSFDFEGEMLDESTFMERNNVVGLLVIKDDEIVLEKYRQDYDAEQKWISFSMAKSFSTTLVGAAVKDGAINSVDDLLTEYLPVLAGTAYDGITVEQLLTMTTGAEWNEDYADSQSDVARIKVEPSIQGSDPVVAYMARKQREAAPGTKFQYNTGETHLVGSLLHAATGKYLADYLSEKIWIPYGMELDANWMVTKGGIEQAGCCLSVSLRDFGRFAMFCVNGAEIDGVSIVPENWIATATKSTKAAQESEMFENRPGMDGYGYMWWTMSGAAYRAIGIFGQLIHINPDSNLIIVIQSAWPTALASTERSRAEAFTAAVEAALVH